MHKAGFVNIVGNPNVGKSTLTEIENAKDWEHRLTGIAIIDDNHAAPSQRPEGCNVSTTFHCNLSPGRCV